MDFDSLVDDNVNQSSLPQGAPIFQDQTKPLMFDDLKEDNKPPQFDDLKDDSEKYSSPLQQAGTLAEGAAQGFLGPLATIAENKLSEFGVPGLSPKEQVARRSQNPGEFAVGETASLVGGALIGTGEAGLIGKGLEHLPQATGALAKVGSAALKGAIGMGLIQGGDEISKALLGQGDPEHPVSSALADIGAASLLGATTGGLFSVASQGASKALTALESTKLGNKAMSFLAGMGHAAQSGLGMAGEPADEVAALSGIADPDNIHYPSFKAGQKIFHSIPGKIARGAADFLGYHVAGPFGGYASDQIVKGAGLEKFINRNFAKTGQKYVGPVIMKMLSNGSVNDLRQALDYAGAISSGEKAISKGVEALFKSGSNEALNYATSERDRDKLKEFIENGGVDKQIKEQATTPELNTHLYAAGGEIKPMAELNGPNAIAQNFPEQNVLLNTAKGRISGYLNSVRPITNQNKLPFDSDQKDPQKEHEYNKVLDLANKPLSILKHIKDGTLVPKHVAAFTQMYPELYNHLSKKITGEMMKNNLKEEDKPPYHTRQALSLFLGTSLDSTITPQGILAAQNVFAQQRAQKVQMGNSKSSILSKMGKNMMTLEQSREQRLNKG